MVDDGASITISNNKDLFQENTLKIVPENNPLTVQGFDKTSVHRVVGFGIMEIPLRNTKIDILIFGTCSQSKINRNMQI